MRLRYVLLSSAAIGAAGALLLAADLYRRMRDAENLLQFNNAAPAPDSIVHFGSIFVLGLLAL